MEPNKKKRRLSESKKADDSSDLSETLDLLSKEELKEKILAMSQEKTSIAKDLVERDEEILDLRTRIAAMGDDITSLKSFAHDLLKVCSGSAGYVREAMFDPAINFEFQLMKDKVNSSTEKFDKAQLEAKAAQFNAQSMTGRRLIEKCRTLQEENEELGKQISEGVVQQLIKERDFEKSLAEETAKKLREKLAYIQAIDAEREEMFQEIYRLKQGK